MTVQQTAIRLATGGKAQVKQDFAETAQAGTAAMDQIADAAEAGEARASTAADRAAERRIASWKKMAAAAGVAETSRGNQATFDATLAKTGSVNLDRSTGSARASAAVFQEQFQALADAEAAANRLRAAIDPLWLAEQKLERELREVALAETAGVLSTEQLAQAQVLARKRFAETTDEIERQRRAGNGAGGLSVMQRHTLIYTASDIIGSSASGMSPGMIAMQQGPQVLQAFATEEGGLMKLRAILNPVTVGIGLLSAAVVAGGAAWLSYSNAVEKQTALAAGAGRAIGATGAQLEASAEAAARAGDMSVAAAREVEAGYVQLGGIGRDVLAGLTALTTDFAAATGQDAAGAQKQLGEAFQDPIKGAEEMAARYDALTQAQIDHIQKLVEQGDLYGAQRALLNALEPAFDGAADHANVLALAWRSIGNAASDAWTAMGRAIDVALGGGSTLDRLNAKVRERQNTLQATMGQGDTSAIDAEITRLRGELQAERNRSAQAGRNAARQRAAALVEQYQGDDRADTSRRLGTLRAAIKAGGSADQMRDWNEALAANQHALDTWMPAQAKATALAAADARMAAAKTPAAKAAAAADRERIEQSGKVVTASAAEAQAHAKGAAALATASRAGTGHAATLAREAAALDASARSALTVAAAYLQSDAAGAEAEARRKALTDATRKGIDVEAQVRRQLAVSVGEAAASGARSVSQMRVETAARRDVNAAVVAGSLDVGGMGTALSDEAALRDLSVKKALAYKLGLTDAYQAITATIAAYKQALGEAHDEEAHSQALQTLDQLQKRAEDARLAMRYAGDTTGAGDRAKALLDADRASTARGDSDPDRTAIRDRTGDAVDAEQAASRAAVMAGMMRSSNDNIDTMRVELGLVGKSTAEHARVTAELEAQQKLRAAGVDLMSEGARSVIAQVDAEVQMRSKLQLVQDTMSELEDAGSRFVDDLTNPDGSGLKNLLKDVEQELIKLAAINPLKNLLTGSSLPTLGSVLKLFGGGASAPSGAELGISSYAQTLATPSPTFSLAAIPGFASGTDYAPGGLAWVGENGKELIDLPQGSRVHNAGDTRRLLAAANDGGGGGSFHFDLRGAVMTQDLLEQMNAIGDGAAMRGAAGGSRMAGDRAARAQRRRLGSR